jgi:hypothetical protein
LLQNYFSGLAELALRFYVRNKPSFVSPRFRYSITVIFLYIGACLNQGFSRFFPIVALGLVPNMNCSFFLFSLDVFLFDADGGENQGEGEAVLKSTKGGKYESTNF